MCSSNTHTRTQHAYAHAPTKNQAKSGDRMAAMNGAKSLGFLCAFGPFAFWRLWRANDELKWAG
jgi:hypothetical protein